ncbi:hypothetical protein ACFKHW_37675 [Bradyrhizobium lupini]|uniref:hypothetical protein n=1 Tax=Rhizobium lupini TaxID=136996 RepID=UPI00366CB46D
MTETPKPKADNGTRSTYAGRDLRPEIYFVPFPDEEAVVIGEGIDLISGRRKPIRCVTMTPAERITFNNKDALFSEVTDEESLWEKLNMSISARASYAGYSGGAKYSSSVETTTSSKKISIVVQSALKTYAMMLPSPPNSGDKKIDLTDYARRLAAQPVLFRQICGDGFISQVTYGADLYGVFDFHSLSYEQKKEDDCRGRCRWAR